MKRLAVLSSLFVLLVGIWVVARPEEGSAVGSSPYERAATFDHHGWHLSCSSQPCPVPIVVPWSFQLATVGPTYDAVITASFTYRSSRGLRLGVEPNLSTGGNAVTVAFSSRPLASSPKTRTGTATWLVQGLSGSSTYGLDPSASVLGSAPISWTYAFTDITLVVEGTPV